MHITSKGQVTIPLNIRQKMGLLSHTEVTFHIEKGRLYLKKVETKSARSQQLIKRMQGSTTVRMTTDEIMALTRGEEK